MMLAIEMVTVLARFVVVLIDGGRVVQVVLKLPAHMTRHKARWLERMCALALYREGLRGGGFGHR
jgi:hypothetical protein